MDQILYSLSSTCANKPVRGQSLTAMRHQRDLQVVRNTCTTPLGRLMLAREEAMGNCAKVAAVCILGVLGSIPHGAAMAADLIILSNQGATPGVRELAAAFSRASGHHVTVIQAGDAILQQRVNDGTADLISGNPGPIAELVRNGKVVAGTVTP